MKKGSIPRSIGQVYLNIKRGTGGYTERSSAGRFRNRGRGQFRRANEIRTYIYHQKFASSILDVSHVEGTLGYSRWKTREVLLNETKFHKGISIRLRKFFKRCEIKIWNKKKWSSRNEFWRTTRRLLSRDGSRSANEHEIRRIHYFSFNNPCSIYMVITKLSDPKLPLSRAVKESTSSRQRIISVRAKEMGQREN